MDRVSGRLADGGQTFDYTLQHILFSLTPEESHDLKVDSVRLCVVLVDD